MEILEKVKSILPAEVISRIELEGSEIVVYTKDRDFFVQHEDAVRQVVEQLKKRIEIRPEVKLCSDQEATKKIITEIVPEDAKIRGIYFEEERSLVIIVAEKPGLVIGRGGETFKQIKAETLWVPRIERVPSIKSDVIDGIRKTIHTESKFRKEFLNKIGEKIFSERKTNRDWIRIIPLGGFREVGRTCLLVETPKSKVLIDCGINAGGTNNNAYPILSTKEFDPSELDAIILSHSHLDHCLTPDTLVQLADGDIKRIGDVKTGERVEALDFKYSMKIEDIPAIQRGSIEVPNPIYEVRTKTKRIKATGNHPVFVLEKDGNFRIKHVEQLERGDFVATPRVIDIEGKDQNIPSFKNIKKIDDIAQILGYIIGDGCKREPNTVLITDKNINNLKFYSAELKKLGVDNKISTGHRNRINIYSKQFKLWLENIDLHIFNKSREKRVPSVISKSRKGTVAAFLRGLYDAEGCVKHHSIVLSTSSQELAQSVQLLLLRFGIISHLYDHDQSKSTFGGKDAFQICISNPQSLDVFFKEIGFSDKRKAIKLENMMKRIGGGIKRIDFIPINEKTILDVAYELGLRKVDLRKMNINYQHYSSHSPTRDKIIEICEKLSKIEKSKGLKSQKLQVIKKLVDSQIFWDQVVNTKIIQTSSKDVFDLTVPGHSNFIANGIFVHNCGFVPYLYEYGYEGPLYCTTPSLDLFTLLCLDYIDVIQKNAVNPPFTGKGVKEAVRHSITLDYGEVSDVAPDVRLTLQNAGHILGSALVHLHIGEGMHNIVYALDQKFARTNLLEPAFTDFQRIETLIIESTYGGEGDIMPPRSDVERQLMEIVNRTMEKKGQVLIPSFSVERAQELMAILVENNFQSPVFLDGMIWDANGIFTAYPEYLSRNMQKRIFGNQDPFKNEIFKRIASSSDREKAWNEKPSVIISTSGMLMGGPVMEHLKNMAENENNTLMFVGYQGEGTLGRRIQKGWREIPIRSDDGKNISLKLKMDIQTIEGLSGHSDRNQLLNFVDRLTSKPDRIITCHGEPAKTIDLAKTIHKMFRIETISPKNLESIRLR